MLVPAMLSDRQSTGSERMNQHERTDGHHGSWHGRIEDDPLVRGRGRFSDDVRPAGAAYACFVRSPHAFAEIRKVDAAAARRAPGVLAVLTAADLAPAQFATVSAPVPMPGRGGVMVKWPHRPALAGERVLHVGEPVALVVGETPEAAQDAAALQAAN
jgi:carbon-monoxide dehydrogenase large subunit